ncbi:MAG: putative ABC transport system permease protein [Phormidesmis priestleyi Ana]|uniref:Putative ABC transport system permease protein n=1 Tax=Phormidesmis priestleyi Ana TaxID=1666911 RepID=A0A0P7ZNR9_9CYAN|nr:MAG: putative ABC transport system permease protein [Phormidesmis priestleyi Ana]
MIEPNLVGMLWATGMMAIAIALASWQGLGLAKLLAIATGRTIIQLLGVGIFLAFVFETRNPLIILALLALMVTIAATVARSRIDRDLPGLLKWVWLAIFLSGLVTMSYVSLLVIHPDPWYDPRYLIPLSGIVLGNAMTAASIAGERLVNALRNNRVEIETHLSLGATPIQAVQKYRQAAIKAGLIPTINAMMVVGLVTLPGIITGQILAGANPLTAAVYQILIMFMLALATLIASLLVTYGILKQFFTPAMQLIDPR